MGVWLAQSINGLDRERESTSGGLTTESSVRSRTNREDWMLIPRLSGRIGRDQVALRGNLSGSSSSGDYRQRQREPDEYRNLKQPTQRLAARR
jgi:hypothetical protein